MRSTALFILSALTGCGSSSLTGQWEGTCTVLVGTTPVVYDVELDITEVTDGDVDGSAEVVDEDVADDVGL